MPEIVTKYRVFIASPSDLNEERQSIDEVVKELNMTFGSQNNLVIEVLKWETHSAPGVTINSVQEIINEDIGNTYDLFIGLMWLKFGTPTAVAGSGTEEEFINAYNRFKETPTSLQILFYFKNALPQSLQDINPDELLEINNFKKDLGNENVLYWNFKSVEELQSLLRLHIPRRINSLKVNNKTETAKSSAVEVDKIIESDDLGYLDYIDIAETCLADSTIAIRNINAATEWIGEKMSLKAEEIKILVGQGNQSNSRSLRKIFKATAQMMNEYTARVNVEQPIFFENYQNGIKALSSTINISDDFFNNENIDELIESKKSIVEMNAGINSGLNGMRGFYDSIIALPRIEKEINKAKRNVAITLEELMNDFVVSSQLAIELIKEMSNKIDKICIDSAVRTKSVGNLES
jgi:hypothetical protein